MRLLQRIIGYLVLLPAAVAIVALSVANRDPVLLSLDPVETPPRYYLELPLFLYLFAAVAIGGILASFATWLRQGRWRRRARTEHDRAARLEREVDRLHRDVPKQIEPTTQASPAPMALPGRDAA